MMILYFELVFFFVIGLTLGSFANVVIHRLPLTLERDWRDQAIQFLYPNKHQQVYETFNLAYPPSHCPKCSHQIRWFENIPVVSFLLQRGRCRSCKVRIPFRYPLVELSTGIAFTLIAYAFADNLILATAYCLFAFVLIMLLWIDADKMLLPDQLTLPALWAGLLLSAFEIIPVGLFDAVTGAAVGYLTPYLINHTYRLIRKRDGMGYGDFKLLALFGAWFGWESLPFILAVGSILALCYILLLRSISPTKPQPFGPALILAAAVWAM